MSFIGYFEVVRILKCCYEILKIPRSWFVWLGLLHEGRLLYRVVGYNSSLCIYNHICFHLEKLWFISDKTVTIELECTTSILSQCKTACFSFPNNKFFCDVGLQVFFYIFALTYDRLLSKDCVFMIEKNDIFHFVYVYLLTRVPLTRKPFDYFLHDFSVTILWSTLSSVHNEQTTLCRAGMTQSWCYFTMAWCFVIALISYPHIDTN